MHSLSYQQKIIFLSASENTHKKTFSIIMFPSWFLTFSEKKKINNHVISNVGVKEKRIVCTDALLYVHTRVNSNIMSHTATSVREQTQHKRNDVKIFPFL